MESEKLKGLYNELEFQYSRSSGPGGQHVNRTESRVELRFNVLKSDMLTEMQKSRIVNKHKNRINSEGILSLTSQVSRSQLFNKKEVTSRFFEIITISIKEEKIRKPTRPGRNSIEKRIERKKQLSEKKLYRKRIDY